MGGVFVFSSLQLQLLFLSPFSAPSAFLFLPFFILLPNGASLFPYECPNLIDGTLLEFANPEGIQLVQRRGADHLGANGCANLLRCDVIGAPVELVSVEWILNGNPLLPPIVSSLVHKSDFLAHKQSQLGLGEVSHRICADRWLIGAEDPFIAGGEQWEGGAEFRCIARLPNCGAGEGARKGRSRRNIVSDPLQLAVPLGRRRKGRETRERLLRQAEAPLISAIISSRMELAGTLLQMMCRSADSALSKTDWEIVAKDSKELEVGRPVSDYPFIKELPNGDLLIDTEAIDSDVTSYTLRCRVRNGFGEDSANSTIILVSEEQIVSK